LVDSKICCIFVAQTLNNTAMAKKSTTIRALLIDPTNRTITEIQVGRSFRDMYPVMECDMIEAPDVKLPHGDEIYCDEEGKLSTEKLKKGGFFYPATWNDVIVGKTLVVGRGGGNAKSTPDEILNHDNGLLWVSGERLVNAYG
jgi:hypothetical protein